MPHDPRITIRLHPGQIQPLRNILQKLERYPRIQALLGLTYEETRIAREALERLPLIAPAAVTDNQQPATSN